MATHQLAQGLASLGRHGDSMLMHVNPSEVAGLKAIGAMTGREVTTNPHTGMPEAFSFGDFLSSLLPTLVGVALAPETFGGSLGITAGSTAAKVAPIIGGMATGAAVAGAKGEDVLTGGLMGGLGGYGGGNLGSSLGKLGAGGGYAAGQAIPTGQAITSAAGKEALNAVNPLLGTPGTVNPALTNLASTATSAAAAPTTASQGLSNLTSGISKLTDQGGFDAFKQAGGSGMQIAAPLGLAALSGAQEDMYPKTDLDLEARKKAEENKYRDPRTGLLNLTQASPGLRLAAAGGEIKSYATGGLTSTVTTGGLTNLYNNTDMQANPSLSRDGYGIGRLENLAAEGSRAKAADSFYAMGGPVSFAEGGQNYLQGSGDGMSDSIPATIEGKQPARLADSEFVIPADVVSHLGNGSSKAGAKQLYAMLSRIRKARTGNPKQGKEIKPEKYLPA